MISDPRKEEKSNIFLSLCVFMKFFTFHIGYVFFKSFNDEKIIVKMYGYQNYFVSLRYLGTLFSRFVSQQSAP